MSQIPNLKLILILQLAAAAVVSGAAFYFGGARLGASTLAGAVLMTANLVLLAWSWARLMSKKSIAWTVAIIVIKYAVLLSSIYFLAQTPWFSPVGAGLGIASFLMAALALAVVISSKSEKAAG